MLCTVPNLQNLLKVCQLLTEFSIQQVLNLDPRFVPFLVVLQKLDLLSDFLVIWFEVNSKVQILLSLLEFPQVLESDRPPEEGFYRIRVEF